MAQLPKLTNLNQLIALLSDMQWHSAHELAEKVTWRFGSIVHEARRQGYSIEMRKVANNEFEYRLLSNTLSLEELKALSQQLLERIPYLKMLVLFGSRATGKTHANSDWDFAALYDEKLRKNSCKDRAFAWFEVPILLAHAFDINSDKIDVVELNQCTPLLGYHVARDGKLLYEKQPGEFINFQLQAWKNYADTAKFRKAQRQSIELWLQKWGV